MAGQEVLERLLPQRATDGEAVEAVDRRADPYPLKHLCLVCAAAEHDARDAAATLGTRLGYYLLAGSPAIQSFDLPDVRLDAARLQSRDGRDDEVGPQLAVVFTLVAAEPIQLRPRGRHQQLEEELALPVPEPMAERREPLGLPAIQVRVTVGVVADQHLDESWIERLYVRAEIVAVLKLKLILTGPLHRHREWHALGLGTARNTGAKLLVYQDTAGARRGARSQRLDVSVEDELLNPDDAVPHRGGDRFGRPE